MTGVAHLENTLTTSDGLSLYYRSDIVADSAATVLLLHGLGEHSGRYSHVIEALNAAGYTVHSIDHRGHGRSGGRRVFVRSYDEFMNDIELFRTTVTTDMATHGPLIVLGHSMGGNLALGHVLGHPTGVAGLALSGPALKPGSDIGAVTLGLARILGRIAPRLRPEALDATAISRDPNVVADYNRDPLVYTGKMSAGIAAALLGAMAEFPGRYAELSMPMLLLHGTEDRLANIEGSRELQAGAVNADVTAHYYPGLFHEVFNEPERAEVITDLITWLQTVTTEA